LYTHTYHNFNRLFNFSKNVTHDPRISNGNSDSIAIKNISFQIHKSPSVLCYDWGFCCCSGQSAGEKLRQTVSTSNKPSVGFSVAHIGDRGYVRHIFLDENQMAYHSCSGAEYVLSVVSRPKVKSRQRVGSRSDIRHLRPGQRHRLTPKYKPYQSSSERSAKISPASHSKL